MTHPYFLSLHRQPFRTTKMKNVIIYAASAALLLNSCGTYTGEGAYAGAMLGSVIGSAIGGISDGRRGHDMGTLIGMAGGAIVGGAVGAMADQQDRRERHEHYERIQQRKAQEQQQSAQQTDDIIDFDETDEIGEIEEIIDVKALIPKVEIRHAFFADESGDSILTRNEEAKLTFEVYNIGDQPLFGLEPMVVETSGNKYIHISPSIIVEKVRPHRGIRYTATIKADNRTKDGTACLQALVRLNGQPVGTPVEFHVNLKKKL